MFIIDIKHNVKAMNGFFFFQKALWDRFITSLKNGLQQFNQGEVCSNKAGRGLEISKSKELPNPMVN